MRATLSRCKFLRADMSHTVTSMLIMFGCVSYRDVEESAKEAEQAGEGSVKASSSKNGGH